MAASLAKFRLAWRDLWAQGRRSIFFALLVAAGVASLVGVQGMARSLETSMHDTAKQMIQGDVLITKSAELTQKQKDALHELEHQGAKVSDMMQLTGHIEKDKGHTMMELKMVDPDVWPMYGGLKTEPANIKLGKGETVVGPELLTSLKVKVGDTFEVNKVPLKIVGIIKEEPMPLGQVPMGPRVLITWETWGDGPVGGLQQTTVKLPSTIAAEAAKTQLLKTFDESAVISADDAWKSLSATMNQVFTFLSMVALISLLVGGLGVAMAMRTFISHKLEQIAVMKAVGSSNGTIIQVFLLEAGLLGLGGSLVGAGLGLGVQVLLPKLFVGLYPVGPVGLNWPAAFSGMAAGVAIALLSALIPVRAIRAIKPVALFRGDTGASKMGWKAWVEAIITGLLTLGGVAWMTVIYAKSVLAGLGFLGGLLGATLILFVIAWLMLRLTRLLPQKGFPATRHAIRSLNAAGNQSGSVVVAMGLGILLMATVYLLQSVLIQQIKTVGVGPNTPNLYVMSMKAERRGEMVEFLRNHEEIRTVMDPTLAVQAEILTVDGKTLAELGLEAAQQEMLMESPVEIPKGTEIIAGEYFTSADNGQPRLSVSERYAATYGLKVGSSITFKVKDQTLPYTVASIWRTSEDGGMEVMTLHSLATAPGALDNVADQFMVTAATRPHKVEEVMGDLMDEFPEAMPLSLDAYVRMFEGVLNRVANILRFLTAFAVVAAGVILSGSLSATRFRRRKEAALLKSLGATRLTVAVSSAMENGLLGIVAGLAGGGLAYVLVQIAGMALDMRLEVGSGPIWLSALAGGVLAILVGVGSTVDVLQVKPLSVLRSE